MEEHEAIQAFSKSLIDQLNDIHQDLVGETINRTDLDKVIAILVVLSEKIENLDNHTHSIS